MAEKTYAERLKPSGNSFKDAFASAKKSGKKEFTWKGRDYTTVTKSERKQSLQKESRKEKFYTHKGKKYMSDVKGDRPRRESYDTQVMASEGGRVKLMQGGFPKLARKGWK